MKRHSISALSLTLCAACILTLCTACGGGDTLNGNATTVAALALGETAQADDDGTLGALAFSEPTAASAPGKADGAATAQERIDAFKQYVAQHISCADTVSVSGGAKITFAKDCGWAGKRWTGDITFTYADANTVSIVFSGLSVAGATTEGTLTVARVADGQSTVSGTRTTTAGERTVETAIDAEYRWDDTSITIVSSKRVRTVDGAPRTYTASGVHWLRGEVAPEAGSMSWISRAGATYTVVYSRSDQGELQMTVTTPQGTETLAALDVAG